MDQHTRERAVLRRLEDETLTLFRRKRVERTGKTRRVSLLLSLPIFLIATTVLGHHSFTSFFDPSRTVSIEGVVTEFQFRAPHSYIRLDVTNDASEVVLWELETTSPGQLLRLGLTPDALGPGDRIAAVGNPARDGRPLMRLLTLTMPDGAEVKIQ